MEVSTNSNQEPVLCNILTDFSEPALIQAIEANQIGTFADLGRSPQVTLHESRELLWFVVGIPSANFNRVLRAQFKSKDVETKIEQALDLFRSRNLPMSWHTGPSTRPPDLGQRLLDQGLTYLGDEPGMAVDLRVLDDLFPPPGLRIEQASTPEDIRTWCRVFTRAFGISEWVGDAMAEIEASLGQHPCRRLYLGRLGGKPVATALLFLGAGVAGLYAVGTLPEARQLGIGTTMTLLPLLEARTLGYRIGVLHASPAGLGIYRRLGFQTYCELGRYVWEGETKRR